MVKITQRSKHRVFKKTRNVHKKLKTNKLKNKESYNKMTVDEFLSKSFESSDSAHEEENDMQEDSNDKQDTEDLCQQEFQFCEESDDDNDPGDTNTDEFISHKESLIKLKNTDPEFYQFLKENDEKLLEFNLSDSDSENIADEEEIEQIHKPTADLEVASDESDFEADEEKTDKRLITLKKLKAWQKEIQVDKTNKTIICLTRAFHSAVLRVSNDEKDDEPSFYKVEGSAIFNGVIQICVLELGPAIRSYLGLKSGSKQAPHKCKKFTKIKTVLRGYFIDLLKILNGVTSTNILNVLLKHLHYMSPLIVSFMNVTKPLLKKLVHLWGTSDETVRVTSFLCILRITNNQQQKFLDTVLKTMYMTYIKNSKFVNINSLSGIHFMQRSLVEMFALNVDVSYQHVFLYIRQLAIHLRNAIIINKKENIQTVYNWQFINSLRLWKTLFSGVHKKRELSSLIYPFIQICLGVIKLVPTAQYYPLRFHVVQVLIDLSRDTNVFIPVLPFLLEILTSYDFNRKNQKMSMKPTDYTCVLRLSKSQLTENGFKDTVIDLIYAQLLEYLASKSHCLAFPDLSFFCITQIKLFLRKCSVSNYSRKLRQLLEKIEQNNEFIFNERKNVNFNLKDTKQIEAWETIVKNKGTPLYVYYESWNKLRTVKKNKQVTNNETLGDYNLPVLKKNKQIKGQVNTTKEKLVLFQSDSDDDDDDGQKINKEPRRGKRGRKNINKQTTLTVDTEDVHNDEKPDVVKDIEISDW